MISHEQAEVLAATAIDFPLTADEAGELAAHRRMCTACRDVEAQLRADAGVLRDLTPVDAPFAIREAIEDAIARPEPMVLRRVNRPMLVLIAATLLLALATGGLIAGSLLSTDDDDVLVVEPSPTPTASSTASPDDRTSSESPSPAPSETAEGGATPASTTLPPVELDAFRWARLLEPLNLRSEPNVGAAVVTRLNRGRLAYVLDAQPTVADGYTWYRVVTSQDEVGWMAGATSQRALMYQRGVDAVVVYCATPRQRPFTDGAPAETLELGNLELRTSLFSIDALAAADLAYGDGVAEVCATMAIQGGVESSATMQTSFRTCGTPSAGAVEWYLGHGARLAGIHSVVFRDGGTGQGGQHRLLLLAGAGAGPANDRSACVEVTVSGGLSDSVLASTFSADVCAEVVSVDDAAVVLRGVAPWSTEEYRFERYPGSSIDEAIDAGATLGVTIEIPGGTEAPVTMRPASLAGCGTGS